MNKTIFSVWKEIFSRPAYLFILIVSLVLFYAANVIIQNFSNLSGFYSAYGFLQALSFLFSLSVHFRQTITPSSYVTLVTAGFLFGMLISLMVYKARNTKAKIEKNSGILSTLGISLALLAPGCAACGIGLVAVLGLTGVTLAFLPYKGLEISVLSIAILAFTIFKMSKDMTICEVCSI